MLQRIMKGNGRIKIYIVRKPRLEIKAAQPCNFSAQQKIVDHGVRQLLFIVEIV